jgi:hypothetical protein
MLESQTDGVAVVPACAAVDNPSSKRNPIEQRGNLGNFPALPWMARNHASPVIADVVRIRQLGLAGGQSRNRKQIHNNRERKPPFHFSSRWSRGSRPSPVTVQFPGSRRVRLRLTKSLWSPKQPSNSTNEIGSQSEEHLKTAPGQLLREGHTSRGCSPDRGKLLRRATLPAARRGRRPRGPSAR